MFTPTNRKTGETPQVFFPEDVIVAVTSKKQLIAVHLNADDYTLNVVYPLDPLTWYMTASPTEHLDPLYYIANVAVKAVSKGLIGEDEPVLGVN